MIPPFAEGRVSTDHHETAGVFFHQLVDVLQLFLAERRNLDVAVDHHVILQQTGQGLRKSMGRMLDRIDLFVGFRVRVHGVEELSVIALLAIKCGYFNILVGLQRVPEVFPFWNRTGVLLWRALHVEHVNGRIDHFQGEASKIVGREPLAR